MSNNFNSVGKIKEYSVFSWSDDSFFGSVKSITNTATDSIHEISLRAGSKVYLVPQAFYERVKIAIKKSNQDKE